VRKSLALALLLLLGLADLAGAATTESPANIGLATAKPGQRPPNRVRRYDYFLLYDELHYGVVPRVGESHSIGVFNNPQTYTTFVMNRERGYLLEIEPLDKPASVVLYGSLPGSVQTLEVLWRQDRFTEPVRFWTDTFWKPWEEGNAQGYPKLRFVALEGRMQIYVLDRRNPIPTRGRVIERGRFGEGRGKAEGGGYVTGSKARSRTKAPARVQDEEDDYPQVRRVPEKLPTGTPGQTGPTGLPRRTGPAGRPSVTGQPGQPAQAGQPAQPLSPSGIPSTTR
jgi:hypothetical protein